MNFQNPLKRTIEGRSAPSQPLLVASFMRSKWNKLNHLACHTNLRHPRTKKEAREMVRKTSGFIFLKFLTGK